MSSVWDYKNTVWKRQVLKYWRTFCLKVNDTYSNSFKYKSKYSPCAPHANIRKYIDTYYHNNSLNVAQLLIILSLSVKIQRCMWSHCRAPNSLCATAGWCLYLWTVTVSFFTLHATNTSQRGRKIHCLFCFLVYFITYLRVEKRTQLFSIFCHRPSL